MYYEYIEEKLHTLASRITTAGKLNVLNLHLHSEAFYLHFFNTLYGYNLENLNKYLQNAEAIDLIDHDKKIVIQVSSTNTKAKVESALDKEIIKEYSGYTFKFISIAKDTSSLRKNSFVNKYSIIFDPQDDIHDIASILSHILNQDIETQKEIYQFIKKELGGEVDIVKLDSNLATIINILAKEEWNDANKTNPVNHFEIENKISYNELNSAKTLVEEYSLYHGKVDTKYAEFDSLGMNKSNSVLATMKREYLKLKDSNTPDNIFFLVVDTIRTKIIESANYIQLPIDELDLCVDILVVDAFIRCKIFENPEGYQYATS